MSDSTSVAAPPILVIMGVSGSGKSTIGDALAARLGWPYQEGDDFHPPANVAKMRAGKPLDDADRQPWLAAIAQWMDAQTLMQKPAVIGCSALKRAYRDLLREAHPQVWFVYLRVPREALQQRVATRHHEYMPASLLDSQLATLEEPASDEPRTVTVDAEDAVDATLDAVMHHLHAAHVPIEDESMTSPARNTTTTVIPGLRYRHALAAIEWLCRVFGFEQHAVYAEGEIVHHAQLTFGNGMIMLGSVDNGSAWGKRIAQPDEIGGRETQACYVVVADCAAHYARARAAGAQIVDELASRDYGGSGYSCHDIEGHLWSFGDYDPWAEHAA